MLKFHYTYLSSDDSRYYIGVRSSKVHPDQDDYFGSFRDRSFKPYKKIILGLHDTREDAVAAEIYWHNLFEVDKNPLFANKAKQTSTGFDYRLEHTEETKEKIRKAVTGKNNGMYGVKGKNHPGFGKSPSEETRRKISKANKGKMKGEKNPFYGKTHTKEAREKISKANKEKIPWNEGKKGVFSEKTRKKWSEKRKGMNKGKENPSYDHTIYLFIHDSGIEELCTSYELFEKCDYITRLSAIGAVKNGKRFKHKGWRCLCLLNNKQED